MEAIILSRRDFRERDQIITIYTKEQGKLELLARGVKKIVSKNAPQLEPFSYVMIEVVPGREIQHLTTAQPLQIFASIRSNLEKSLSASLITTTTDRLVQVGQKDARIFSLLKSWLTFVDRAASFHFLLVDGYLLSLLGLLGFAPILDHCVVCDKSFAVMVKEELSNSRGKKSGLSSFAKASEDKPFINKISKGGLYFAGGGLVCPECREIKQSVGEEIELCGLKEISDLQILLKGDWRLIINLSIDTDEIRSVHRLVAAFAAYHTERQLPDWTALERHGIVNLAIHAEPSRSMTNHVMSNNNA